MPFHVYTTAVRIDPPLPCWMDPRDANFTKNMPMDGVLNERIPKAIVRNRGTRGRISGSKAEQVLNVGHIPGGNEFYLSVDQTYH